MKKLVLSVLFFVSLVSFSQAPQYINYQAIARDAVGNIVATPIGIKFEILQGSATGALIYDETTTAIPSSAGIFTTAIGGGVASTGTFSAINWATGPYFLRVNIDPSGGTSYITVGTNQLLSVPYALYAATSGNSSTTYSAGNGIAISSGSIINTAMNQTVNITGAGTTTVSGTYPNYIISSSSTATASAPASTLVINPPHNITNLGPNNNSITIQPTNITATTGIATIGGTYPNYNIFVPPPVLTISGSTITIMQGSAATTQTFGVTGPWYKPSASAVSITGVNDNVGIGTTIPANRLQVIESNAGIPAIGASNNYTATAVGNAMGIYASSANSHSVSAGVYGTHSGAGVGVSGINTSTFSTAAGVYGLVTANFTTAIGVEGYGTGAATGIKGTSSGNGISIYGTKPASASGTAGKFDILNPSNSSDALLASTTGPGAAVHAVSGTTGTSALALHIDNGHIRSSSTAAPTQFSVTIAGGFTTPGFAPTCVGTDVKGVISFSTSATGFAGANSFDIQYNFQKAYSTAPTVILTPTTDFKGLFYMLLSSSTSNFVVRIYRPNGASFPTTLGASYFNFNYFIIE